MKLLVEYELSSGRVVTTIHKPDEDYENTSLPPAPEGRARRVMEGESIPAIFGGEDPLLCNITDLGPKVDSPRKAERQSRVQQAQDQKQKLREFMGITAAAFSAMPDAVKLQKLFEGLQALAHQVENP
jgi:hypothetical protein